MEWIGGERKEKDLEKEKDLLMCCLFAVSVEVCLTELLDQIRNSIGWKDGLQELVNDHPGELSDWFLPL